MDIILTAQLGDKTTEVRLENPQGGNSGNYHIMIDDYFHGQVCKMDDGWHVYPNDKSWLSPEDCEVIREAVNRQETMLVTSPKL